MTTPIPKPPRQVRTDIQALRALAVAAVLGYHFAPDLVPGGYVGVDVFFVISGFVITSLMLSELRSTGALSFARFYARRARRILPAATVTIILTVLAGFLLWPLNTWKNIADDAFYTAIFGQNWHLAATSVDYLAGGGTPSPMQHFWSLSIEEQFYFLWPAALIGAYLLIRKRSVGGAALLVLIPTILLTFTWSVLAVANGDPSAYFTSHTRAWQLGIGALLAVAWPAVNKLTGNPGGALEPGRAPVTWRTAALLVVGVGLNLFALFTYASDTPFPGVAALAPTLGTAALIAAGVPAAGWVDSRPVQWLGNVSYSLYLVHWPIALFLPQQLTGVARAVLGLGLSLVLAHVSYVYIEKGVPGLLQRNHRVRINARTLVAGAVAILTAVAVSGAAHAVVNRNVATLEAQAHELLELPPAGFGAGSIDPERYTALLPGTRGTAPSRMTVRDDLPGSYDTGCVGENTDRETPQCEYGDEDAAATWVLLGDSHIDQYLPAFLEIVEEHDVRVVTFFHANCPFNASPTARDVEWGGPCQDSNASTIERLSAIDADLVITSNWTVGEWAGDPVEGFIEAWTQVDAPIVVIADNPEMEPADGTTSCVVENYPHTERCAIPRSEAIPVDHQLPAAQAAARDGLPVDVVDLTDVYCTAQECPPVIGNVMVYRDPHHITATYMQTIAPQLWDRLAELVAHGDV